MPAVFNSPILAIGYDQLADWLYVTWHDEQNEHSVIEGCREVLQVLAQYPCEKLLMDSSRVSNMWTHAAEWGEKEWFPALQRAGVRYLAFVYSPAFYSRMSFDLAIRHVQQPIISTFDDLDRATAWLRHV
jgi:hypothetical protein